MLAGKTNQLLIQDMKDANKVLERLQQQAPPMLGTPCGLWTHGGTSTVFSLLSYPSRKLRRVASSTLMTETLAMGEGLAVAEWSIAWLDYIKDGSYERRCDQLRSMRGRDIQLTAIQPKTREGEVWS
eukprot:939451-Amphidinium_carterae.1